MNILDYYTSINPEKRDQEEYILKTLTNHRIIPSSIRFDEENTIVKTINNKYYFFKGTDTENIVEVSEFDFVSKAYAFGCDLVKAGPGSSGGSGVGRSGGSGSAGSGGGGGMRGGMGGAGQRSSGGIAPVSEADEMEAENEDITEKHPSGAMGTTPDQPNRGRIWHEDQIVRSQDIEMLNDLAKTMDEMNPNNHYSDEEKKFLLSLGKTPEEVESGNAKMSPQQRVLYQKQLGKSLRNSLYSLQKAL